MAGWKRVEGRFLLGRDLCPRRASFHRRVWGWAVSEQAKTEITKAIEHLFLARDFILWGEDTTGSDKNEQHKLDPFIDGLQEMMK